VQPCSISEPASVAFGGCHSHGPCAGRSVFAFDPLPPSHVPVLIAPSAPSTRRCQLRPTANQTLPGSAASQLAAGNRKILRNLLKKKSFFFFASGGPARCTGPQSGRSSWFPAERQDRGCEEDCAYCPQSMHHSADSAVARSWPVEPVLSGPRCRPQAPSLLHGLGLARTFAMVPLRRHARQVAGVAGLGLDGLRHRRHLHRPAGRTAGLPLASPINTTSHSPEVLRRIPPRAPIRSALNLAGLRGAG